MQQQTPQLSQTMIQERIRQELAKRSAVEYDLGNARANVKRLEAIVTLHDKAIEGLENARSVMADMEQALTDAVAQMAQPVTAPSLPNDGAPAHIVQEEQPAARARTTQTRPKVTKNGKRMGRPPGSGRNPVKMQEEVTVAGYNGNGMTPGEAASE